MRRVGGKRLDSGFWRMYSSSQLFIPDGLSSPDVGWASSVGSRRACPSASAGGELVVSPLYGSFEVPMRILPSFNRNLTLATIALGGLLLALGGAHGQFPQSGLG